jgi:hypothetical protein
MAEYLTLGPVDSQTSMWMRDAALREKLPHIKDLDDPKYFPVPLGPCVLGVHRRQVRRSNGGVAAAVGGESANGSEGLARQLGTDPDTLTANWHQAILKSTSDALDEDAPITSDAHG